MALRTKVKPTKAAKKTAPAKKAAPKRKAKAESNGHANGNGNGSAVSFAGPSVLDVPVEFGGVSIGDQTARLGVRIDRAALNLVAADEIFCGHRLTGRIVLGGRDESPGQSHLFDVSEKVDGTFDVKRISVNVKQIATGLAFSLSDIDIGELAKFSKGSGRLIVQTVAELPEEVAGDDDDDFSGTPSTLKSEGPWREVQLDTLFSGALLKSLKKAGLDTMGALSDYTASEKRLSDIDGIGEAKVAQIENVTLAFWEQNPQYAEGAV